MKKFKAQAFTLIELSIVIIIIGLIAGGIVAGNELISQAKVRGLVREIQALTTSINSFKLKFNYLPGDFPYAGAIWTSATCLNSAAPTGCNGNGNYQVVSNGGVNGSEGYRVWQHLSLANMINGEYTATSAITDQFPLKYSSKTLVMLRYIYPFVNSIRYNVLEIGSWDTVNSQPINGEITPVDAYSIDNKIDDGIANKGRVFGNDGLNVSSGLCSYLNSSPNGLPDYNIIGTQGNYCRLKIVID
ncbi:MAG: prepilin-type N-terminal cleavage/methylation domain-containing protein [Alphaproteobacteria bacterium]